MEDEYEQYIHVHTIHPYRLVIGVEMMLWKFWRCYTVFHKELPYDVLENHEAADLLLD